MAERGPVRGLMAVRAAVAATLAGPLLVLVAVLLVASGVIPVDIGLYLLALEVGPGLSLLAVVVALVALPCAFRSFARLGLIALATLVVAVGGAGAFLWRAQVMAAVGPLDVTTDPADPPRIAGAVGPRVVCPGVSAPMTQSGEGAAGWAMQQAGFRITDASLFQIRGERTGTFFGLRHEAVIRIRPGRTDVRVVARYDRADGGETCRLAGALVAALQAGR